MLSSIFDVLKIASQISHGRLSLFGWIDIKELFVFVSLNIVLKSVRRSLGVDIVQISSYVIYRGCNLLCWYSTYWVIPIGEIITVFWCLPSLTTTSDSRWIIACLCVGSFHSDSNKGVPSFCIMSRRRLNSAGCFGSCEQSAIFMFTYRVNDIVCHQVYIW